MQPISPDIYQMSLLCMFIDNTTSYSDSFFYHSYVIKRYHVIEIITYIASQLVDIKPTGIPTSPMPYTQYMPMSYVQLADAT